MSDKEDVVNKLIGDLIDVNDFGICRFSVNGLYIVYKVEEEDGEINWYLNPDFSSDTLLYKARVEFVMLR